MAGNVGSFGADRRLVNDSALDKALFMDQPTSRGRVAPLCFVHEAAVALGASRGAECAKLLRRLTTGNQPRSNTGMTETLALEMLILLRPELTIERAALEQNTVRRYVDNFARLYDQNLVALN